MVDLTTIKMSLDTQKGRVAVAIESGMNEKLFRKLLHKNCHFFPQNDRDKVIKVVETAWAGQPKIFPVLGIIDADFRRVNNIADILHLFLTDYHDTEIMLINASECWESSFSFYYAAEKWKKVESSLSQDIRSHIFEICKPLSIMRFLNDKHDLGLKFKIPKGESFSYLDYELFINFKNLSFIGSKELTKAIENKTSRLNFFRDNPLYLEEWKSLMAQEWNLDEPLKEFTNGHDFLNIAALFLKKTIGNNETSQISGEDLEKALILSYRISDFKQTKLYKELNDWQNENVPYLILRPENAE